MPDVRHFTARVGSRIPQGNKKVFSWKKKKKRQRLYKIISATIIFCCLAVEEPTSLLWLSVQEE
jgi:hypothetical protein